MKIEDSHPVGHQRASVDVPKPVADAVDAHHRTEVARTDLERCTAELERRLGFLTAPQQRLYSALVSGGAA